MGFVLLVSGYVTFIKSNAAIILKCRPITGKFNAFLLLIVLMLACVSNFKYYVWYFSVIFNYRLMGFSFSFIV